MMDHYLQTSCSPMCAESGSTFLFAALKSFTAGLLLIIGSFDAALPSRHMNSSSSIAELSYN